MIPISIGDLVEVTGARLVPDTSQTRSLIVEGPVVTDSREAAPGSLYVARIGERLDGHDFVRPAAAAGAVAALTSREVDVPAIAQLIVDDVQEAFVALAREVLRRARAAAGLTVIGITGSSGKTSTKDLLAHVLATHAPTVANVGSLNSEVGVPLTVCRTMPDTAFLILEMGARGPGHIRYLTNMTDPEVGVVLNVGSAHLGVFGSQRTIADAKAELVQALEEDGLAVLNEDDPQVAAMAGRTRAGVIRVARADRAERAGRVVAVGAAPPRAQVWADEVRLDPARGTPSFTLHAVGGSARVELGLLGEHHVDNALAVAAVALYLGMGLTEVAAALGTATPASRWRMECHDRPDGLRVINDAYNANPESMAAALRTLAVMTPPGPGGRRWVAVGEMLELGEDSAQRHAAIGELAARLGIDKVLAVGPGAAAVAEGALAAGMPPDQVECVADVDAAYAALGAQLSPADLVLVKSSRDSGLRILGERLSVGDQVERESGEGRE
ncbi:MAG: UDP-N-acetylmuramoyl-tripeptide--D-alanyl-D-alanine ligase [Austwickia sp.]|jgi:UDP-N-acetylmuramoyl-tripeptide--D-alanyl-D-alanine ligase|nr:UDP-N-acetylmuramoyl-tripeptide--D-alanyl-D-alanine ligase [Austwickia sp.]MBK8435739.1 UDP-N-acetylmuramoyl-tripeptide--D-alanyl-D-alanine ligase [Austwickia sp.]MBK9100700.1 UDP-N-acetylmuramoyl-tripeptide--D-alanyl-D-alanine ligase [Austwickia sp.]